MKTIVAVIDAGGRGAALVDAYAKSPHVDEIIAIPGNDLMQILGENPGPKIGQILDVLLGYVLDDPKKNTKEFLEAEATKLGQLDENELKRMAEKSKDEKQAVETKQDETTKQKYWVT